MQCGIPRSWSTARQPRFQRIQSLFYSRDNSSSFVSVRQLGYLVPPEIPNFALTRCFLFHSSEGLKMVPRMMISTAIRAWNFLPSPTSGPPHLTWSGSTGTDKRDSATFCTIDARPAMARYLAMFLPPQLGYSGNILQTIVSIFGIWGGGGPLTSYGI